MICLACENKRVHGPADWENHPYRTHGFTGTVWTHPDLDPHVADAGAANLAVGNLGGGTLSRKLEAAPAGE